VGDDHRVRDVLGDVPGLGFKRLVTLDIMLYGAS